MIIDLPKHDTVGITVINEYMEIENDILKIKFPFSFRKAMYTLTYKIKGKHKCFYCSSEIKKGKATLDHLFPQNFGGPTITNNLEPCCMQCNVKKSNMTKAQFEKFLSLSPTDQKEYFQDLQSVFEFIRKWVGFELPDGWVEEQEISHIITNITLAEDYRGRKYDNVKEYYKKYNHFQKPLIVDRKNFLLDGFTSLMYAKNHNIITVPVIVLENVEVVF